jgi:hypothetical protein
VIPARKHCGKCRHWRHSIDFPVREWADRDKQVPKRLQSWCNRCRRLTGRELRKHLTPVQQERIRATARAHQRRLRRQQGIPERAGGAYIKGKHQEGSVDREPFARWLREKLDNGMTPRELSMRIGLSTRRIKAIIDGYDRGGVIVGTYTANRRPKLRAFDWLTFELVDRCLANWGDPWLINELYPIDQH